jgi:hypothetical protein
MISSVMFRWWLPPNLGLFNGVEDLDLGVWRIFSVFCQSGPDTSLDMLIVCRWIIFWSEYSIFCSVGVICLHFIAIFASLTQIQRDGDEANENKLYQPGVIVTRSLSF